MITCSDKNNMKKTYNPINSQKVAEEEIKEPTHHFGNCFVKIHNWFYDLNPITPKGKELKFKTNSGELIEFNICHDVHTNCTHAKGLIVDKKNCHILAGTHHEDKEWKLEGIKYFNILKL
jgi:hypothetical protein